MAKDVKSQIALSFKLSCQSSQEGTGHKISVSLDEERNTNKTCFLYGDLVYFRIYTTPAIMKVRVSPSFSPSSGSIFSYGEQVEEVKQRVTLAQEQEVNLDKAIGEVKRITSYGNLFPDYVKTGESQLHCHRPAIVVADIIYTTQYRLYAVTIVPQPTEEFPVLILIEEV